MKKINLKEILNSKIDHVAWKFNLDTIKGLEEDILEAMKEACEAAIDLCAENADANYTYIGELDSASIDSEIEVYVITNSILDVKKLIV